jgi:DNA sulfur modification protein DndE
VRYNKLRISEDANSRLRSIRQRTGVTPNLLIRVAIMISLEEGPIRVPAPDEKGPEFNSYTLTGDHTLLIGAMLRHVEETEGQSPPLGDDEMVARLRAHIHRGVGTLSVRAKSIVDLGRLAVGA